IASPMPVPPPVTIAILCSSLMDVSSSKIGYRLTPACLDVLLHSVTNKMSCLGHSYSWSLLNTACDRVEFGGRFGSEFQRRSRQIFVQMLDRRCAGNQQNVWS